MKYLLNFIKGFFFVLGLELLVLTILIISRGDDSILLSDSFRGLLGGYFLFCLFGGGLYATIHK